jgi:chromate transporter
MNKVGLDQPAPTNTTPAPATLLSLFWVFLRIGLTAFGGSTQAWMHREIVERHRWLDERAFLSGFTVAQVLPGANPVNLALYLGLQLRGGLGAAIAVCGMVIPAFCVILLMGYFYRQFGGAPVTHVVLAGVAAVGVGATLSVGIKVTRRLGHRLWAGLIAVIIFLSVGVLHWPMVPIVLVAVPASILLAYLLDKDAHAR